MKERRRACEKRVVEVEHRSFLQVGLSSTGGGSINSDHVQDTCIQIDSAVMCLRGPGSSFCKPMKALDLIDAPADFVVNKG